MIILQLELRNISVVIEPGTDCGGLSHSMARTSRTPPICTHLTPARRVRSLLWGSGVSLTAWLGSAGRLHSAHILLLPGESEHDQGGVCLAWAGGDGDWQAGV